MNWKTSCLRCQQDFITYGLPTTLLWELLDSTSMTFQNLNELPKIYPYLFVCVFIRSLSLVKKD